MPSIAFARPSRWATPRTVIALAVAALVIANVVGGLSRASDRPALRATDAEIEAFLVEQVRDAGYPGAAFAIVRDGKITRSAGIGRSDDSGRPVRAETPFVIGSLSKPVTATAVMQLVERGLVHLDAPVTRYLADFRLADGRASEITVRQLLTHTSGIPTSAGSAPLSKAVTSLQAQVADLASVSLESDPGGALAYSNANYLLLGRLVERVSGTAFGAFIVDNVFEPLGMTHAHVDLATATSDGLTDAHRFWFGIPQAGEPLWRPDLLPAGWLVASAEDLGRFVAANVNGGRIDGRRILSSAGIEQMHKGAVTAVRGAYGMGWIEATLGSTRVVSHSGSTTDMASAMYVAPDQRTGLVVLFNGQSVIYELLHKPEAIAEAAFARMIGKSPGGTLVGLYPIFTVAMVLLLAFLLRSLARVVRAAARGESVVRPVRGHRRLGAAMTIWGGLVLPLLVLWTTPAMLAAPWEILVQIDLGQVLAAYATLQLLTFGVVVAAVVARRARGLDAPVAKPFAGARRLAG